MPPSAGHPTVGAFRRVAWTAASLLLAGVLVAAQAAVAVANPSNERRAEQAESTGSPHGQDTSDGERSDRADEAQEQAAEKQASKSEANASNEEPTSGSNEEPTSNANASNQGSAANDQAAPSQAQQQDSDGDSTGQGDAGTKQQTDAGTQQQTDAGTQQQTDDPPGNNGTVKIDGLEFGQFPANEPHPGCLFQIDFFGYDAGVSASYMVELHPPTDGGVLVDDALQLEDDPAGGGTDHDGAVTLDLSEALAGSGVEPHPNQGFHVRLTVNAEGSIGADVKHKVFWIQCEVGGPAGPPGVTPPPPGPQGPPPGPEGPPGEEAVVAGEQFERKEAQVLGQQFERQLAFTGADVGALLLLALMFLASGVLLARASRTRLH